MDELKNRQGKMFAHQRRVCLSAHIIRAHIGPTHTRALRDSRIVNYAQT